MKFAELLRRLRAQFKDEFVRRMRAEGISQSTWSAWINRGSVPRPEKREAVFRALAGWVEPAELEASLAISDRCVAMTGGYAGECTPDRLVENRIVLLEESLARLVGSNSGHAATTALYHFVTDPCLGNAVAVIPPRMDDALRLYQLLLRSRQYYCSVLAEEVPELLPEHHVEVFRHVVRLCAGSVQEVFRPWTQASRLLPRVVAGGTRRRTDQEEIEEIHRAVIALCQLLASQHSIPRPMAAAE